MHETTSQKTTDHMTPTEKTKVIQESPANDARQTGSSPEDSALIVAGKGSSRMNKLDLISPQFIREYLENYVANTARSYATSLRDFAEFMQESSSWAAIRSLVSLGQFGANMMVGRYRKHLIDQGQSGSTVNTRMAAVKSLFKFCKLVGVVEWELHAKGVKVVGYANTKGPGLVAVQEVLDQVSKGTCKAKVARDEVIIRLLYDCGLRRAEVVRLDCGDVDFNEKLLEIRGKGRHDSEWVPLSGPTLDSLRRWIDLRGHWEGPLVLRFAYDYKSKCTTMKPERLASNGLYWIVREYGRLIGKRVRPHGLRHTAITEALDKTDGDVVSVAAFSRHKDLNTVRVYDDNRKERARKVSDLVAIK